MHLNGLLNCATLSFLFVVSLAVQIAPLVSYTSYSELLYRSFLPLMRRHVYENTNCLAVFHSSFSSCWKRTIYVRARAHTHIYIF